jgi:hypothetical protein
MKIVSVPCRFSDFLQFSVVSWGIPIFFEAVDIASGNQIFKSRVVPEVSASHFDASDHQFHGCRNCQQNLETCERKFANLTPKALETPQGAGEVLVKRQFRKPFLSACINHT